MAPPTGRKANANVYVLLAVVGVVLLVGGIFLGKHFFNKKDPPPNGPKPKTDDVEKVVRDELGKMKAALEKANRPVDLRKVDDLQTALLAALDAQKKDIEALKAQLEEAKQKGDKEAEQRLTDALKKYDDYFAALGKQLTDYGQLAAAAIDRKEELPKPEQPIVPPDPPPPVVPPPSEDKKDGNGLDKALKPIFMAACLYYPPACVLGAILPNIAGLFDKEEHREAFRGVVEDVIAGKPPSPEHLQKLAGAVAGKKPEEVRRVIEVVNRLTEALPPDQRKKIEQDIAVEIDKAMKADEPAELKPLREAMAAGKPLPEVLKTLKQVGGKPRFSTAAVKQRAEIMCKANPAFLAKYWEPAGGLKGVEPEVP